jgi:hypothetical protein
VTTHAVPVGRSTTPAHARIAANSIAFHATPVLILAETDYAQNSSGGVRL